MAIQKTQSELAPKSTESPDADQAHQEIAALAYALWQDRGRPYGSPDEDWFRAHENWLRAHEEASQVRRQF